MILRHEEYFAVGLATLPEELFVILKVYADESLKKDTVLTLGGCVATPEQWEKFTKRWNAVLSDFRAPYFHFREYADRSNQNKIKGNPYLHWTAKRRESFLYALAIEISEHVIPVGASFDIAKFRADKGEGDINEALAILSLPARFEQRWKRPELTEKPRI